MNIFTVGPTRAGKTLLAAEIGGPALDKLLAIWCTMTPRVMVNHATGGISPDEELDNRRSLNQR